MKIKFAGSNNLALAVQTVSKQTFAPVVLPIEHIAIIDVSGSMYNDLPELRRHLKNKLPTIVGVNDTITLIWFSGNNQFGVLQEGVPIRSLTDLTALNNAIDRFLQPVCLTGFVQPLQEVVNVIGRLKAKRSASLINVLFMTDGYENQNSQKAVLDASEALSNYADASTIIEFGWNCNRPLLTKMAEAMGGNLIFSEHLAEYQATFERELTKTIGGGKKIAVKLESPAILGYAFTVEGGNLVTYSVNANNEVIVPESLNSVAFFTTSEKVESPFERNFQMVYAGLATLSQRMLANEIFDVLAEIGDVALINKFVNAFSKQDYSDFQTMCMNAATNAGARYTEGMDRNAVPKEDAYTVIDLLNDLSSDAGNMIYPMDPAFGYKRIGAGEKKDENSLKFTPNESNPGIPMNCVVYNSERPNASLQTRMNGTVALPEDRKKFPTLPASVPSFIYRNYTIIRDGIVHTRVLPVSLTADTAIKLRAIGLRVPTIVGEKFNLDISKLPVINRKMVKNVSAKETFTKVFELECLKAAQKVFKHFRDESGVEKRSEGFSILFGADAADWLKDIGITDYNGFNPKSEKEVSGDVYMSKQMEISVAKLSSLPKVEDVITKMKSGKALTLRESIMVPAINAYNAVSTTMTGEELQSWLKKEADFAIANVRKLNLEISKTKFAIIVGHVWFNDLSADQNSLEITANGLTVTVTADLTEKEIAV